MQPHSKSPFNVSIMPSSTIVPSDHAAGSSTITLVPENSSKVSKRSSKTKDKKDKKKKEGEQIPRVPRPQMIFA